LAILPPKDNSSSNADRFQIFSERFGTARPGSVARKAELREIQAKSLTAEGIEGSKRPISRPIIESEERSHKTRIAVFPDRAFLDIFPLFC
jgi:hypothetical protein